MSLTAPFQIRALMVSDSVFERDGRDIKVEETRLGMSRGKGKEGKQNKGGPNLCVPPQFQTIHPVSILQNPLQIEFKSHFHLKS